MARNNLLLRQRLEESAVPLDGESQLSFQPLVSLRCSDTTFEQMLSWHMEARDLNRDRVWDEQAALALAQLTADRLLPSLMDCRSVDDLLDYEVELGRLLDDSVLTALAEVLRARWPAPDWRQVDETTYCVAIIPGITACLDIVPGRERLYLRLAPVRSFSQAGGEPSEPDFDLNALQSSLLLRVNHLLRHARSRTISLLKC